MKLGSLFDGSGGFPLAGVINGIEPVWASEIEPYPLKVTAARFPHVKQLGDVTKINGAEVDPVDVITFGSPCQDLSVAGKQAGIHDGERSNLFFEAVRIIKEMRAKDAAAGRTDEHCRPRFAVWENVPGAFNSNKGADFQAVLQALAEVCDPDVSVPMPPKGKWSKAGCVVGDGWSIAWRTYDAQFWGVPQRRKRIYLVADFASERAGEILFERESVRGDPAQGGETREGTAGNAERGAGGSCGAPVGAFMGGQGAKAKGIGWSETIAPTIKSVMSGSNTVPDVVYSLHDKATRHKGGGETRKNDGAANGLGIQADGKMFTLDTSCRHGIVHRCLRDGVYTVDETCQTLRARIPRDRADIITCTMDALMGGDGDGKGVVYPKITGALCANSHPGSYTGQDAFNDMLPVIKADKPPRKYIVRRLTPLECCRLQGFPDWWEDGVEGSDSARYKMWGNGIALPCAVDVLRRVAKAGDPDA